MRICGSSIVFFRHANLIILLVHSSVYMDANLHGVSVPDTTTVQPGTKLLKKWNIKNAGDKPWSDNTKVGIKNFLVAGKLFLQFLTRSNINQPAQFQELAKV